MESTFGEILSRHNARQRALSPACRNLTREGVQMRKVITLLLAAAMALSLVVITSAASQETVYLRVDKDEAKDGKTVTYTFTLDASKSEGVGALEFYVETQGLTYQGVTYNKGGTQLDDVFKVSTGVAGPGDYRFYENQNYFIAWGGNASDGHLLKNSVVLVALTYQINSDNYKLTVKSGSFKACYSGERQMTDNRYICTVRTGDVLLGDVNNDGKVNGTDALWVSQYFVGARQLTDAQKTAADVNHDGKINGTDALWIAQYFVGSRSW